MGVLLQGEPYSIEGAWTLWGGACPYISISFSPNGLTKARLPLLASLRSAL